MENHPDNEPILNYGPDSKEKKELKVEIERQMSEVIEIPCIVNGKEVYTNNTVTQVIPHNHSHILANVHLADKNTIEQACNAAIEAQETWIEMGMETVSYTHLTLPTTPYV